MHVACFALKYHRFLHGFRKQNLPHSSEHHLEDVSLEDAVCSPPAACLVCSD